MDVKPIARGAKALSKWLFIVAVIPSSIGMVCFSGDIHELLILIVGASLSILFLVKAIVCIVLRTVPASFSGYGRVAPTPWETKPVQFVLCILLFVSISAAMMLITVQRYAEFYP